MKTGPGSDARMLAYAIDSLIIARFLHTHAKPGMETAQKAKVDTAIESLERTIAEVLP